MAQPEYEHLRWKEPFLDATAVLRRWGFSQGAKHYFCASWEERHLWGIPGPLYVGDDDVCGVGPEAAPNNVCLFDNTGEFLFRQPTSEYELRQLLQAAWCNPVSAYAMDGDSHWTPETVAAWWESIQPVRQQLRASIAERDEEVRRLMAVPSLDWPPPERNAKWMRLNEVRPPWVVRRWLDYLDHGAERYLRGYSAFLSTGRMPTTDDET